ncbi:MAG: tRNA(Arg) A34 adenosine deaminase TadA [Natronomonas sp.]|jgi:tRNA(Arg) A34 adenosine deaminase TadA
MSPAESDTFDDESHMQRAFELAEIAVERGDRPFGAVLVRDDEIIMEDANAVNSETDIRRHPELHLAYLACQEMTPDERAETVMYASTMPCSMCARGMRKAGFGRLVYSVGDDEVTEFTGSNNKVSSTAILEDITEVNGPVLNEEGRKLHESFEY